ncbi:MAG: hypothetical protein ABII01_06305 [Candidatus Woesearchaeota archaeon]
MYIQLIAAFILGFLSFFGKSYPIMPDIIKKSGKSFFNFIGYSFGLLITAIIFGGIIYSIIDFLAYRITAVLYIFLAIMTLLSASLLLGVFKINLNFPEILFHDIHIIFIGLLDSIFILAFSIFNFIGVIALMSTASQIYFGIFLSALYIIGFIASLFLFGILNKSNAQNYYPMLRKYQVISGLILLAIFAFLAYLAFKNSSYYAF